jgi:SH3 domain protein
MKKIIIFITLALSLTTQIFAETRYVTDRILLGIHTEADASSTLIKSVPSGTELEILITKPGFLKVRLDDGTEGWVSTGFVTVETPATRKYDVLAHQYEVTTQELDNLKVDYEKINRELEVRRDQISNANTTIRELKKSNANGTTIADPETENKLTASLHEIENLKTKIAQLEAKPQTIVNVDQEKIFTELKNVKSQNDLLQKRIDIAIAHLKGERMVTAEELASIRPKFPVWYWTLLSIVLLLGVIFGYFIMDYRLRRRHGGFRL